MVESSFVCSHFTSRLARCHATSPLYHFHAKQRRQRSNFVLHIQFIGITHIPTLFTTSLSTVSSYHSCMYLLSFFIYYSPVYQYCRVYPLLFIPDSTFTSRQFYTIHNDYYPGYHSYQALFIFILMILSIPWIFFLCPYFELRLILLSLPLPYHMKHFSFFPQST
jgi:hypothetical protein